MSDILLEARGLTRTYSVPSSKPFRRHERLTAAQDVSLTLHSGEILGLVGESGCGKTTVGRMLVGLEKPDSGEVLYRGRRISGLSEREMAPFRREIQMVFQDVGSSLNPRRHVRDILREPMLFHGLCRPEELDHRIGELLELVGLPQNASGRYPHEFSGGQRQRICIAMALSLSPKVLICDEPVSALDVSVQAQILNLLLELRRELGLSMVFIGHGLPAVRYISDRIAVMYMGRLVEMGEAQAVMAAPVHPYTKALCAAVPAADPALDSFAGFSLRGEVADSAAMPAGCRFHPRCECCTQLCREKEPELRALPDGRMAACHNIGTGEEQTC